MPAEQELFEFEHYLDRNGPGYFSLLSIVDNLAKQSSYTLDLLPTVINLVDPEKDNYITQAVFSAPNRRAANVLSVGVLFIDIDTYKKQGLEGLSPEQITEKLLAYCKVEGIPFPSIVLFSGRGLQVKWVLTESLGKVSLEDWNEAQLALVKAFERFGSDKAARDISRVLRLDQTTNTKSGERCRVVYTSSNSDILARYSFEEMAALLTERYYESPEPQQPRIITTRTNSNIITRARPGFNWKRLNWFRYYDIETLWKLRGGVPVGYRELTLFWMLNFFLRAEPVRTAEIWNEAQALAASIDSRGGWWNQSDLSTLYYRAKLFRDGGVIEYRGKQYPTLYNPTNQYLIDLFSIIPDEERQLKTIISYEEKYRRKVERRRAAGVRPREEYLEQFRNSIEKQQPWKQFGISRATWYEKRKRGEL